MWRSKIPTRVAFFSWNTALGKILTLENLWYKSITVVDWCYMCKKSGELVNRRIVFFFIVLLLMNYGLWCGLYLVFYGLCRIVLLIYFRVGKVPLVDIRALIYGGLHHIVSYGKNGTQDVSKKRNSLFWNLDLSFFTLC